MASLDVHARAYIEAVDRESLLPFYQKLLRQIGSKAINDAEKGILLDPYTEERFRQMAESSRSFRQRRQFLTPEQQEAEIRDAAARIREEFMERALKWRDWKLQLLFRLEARYRHWAAEAIERVQKMHQTGGTPERIGGEVVKTQGEPLVGTVNGSNVDTIRHDVKAKIRFPARASWLRDRLLERGWEVSDPYRQRGPDRKTIQKILRGESVRNDILEKLAEALSKKHGKVTVLDIPQD